MTYEEAEYFAMKFRAETGLAAPYKDDMLNPGNYEERRVAWGKWFEAQRDDAYYLLKAARAPDDAVGLRLHNEMLRKALEAWAPVCSIVIDNERVLVGASIPKTVLGVLKRHYDSQ